MTEPGKPRKTLDRHGPFAYFCIGILALVTLTMKWTGVETETLQTLIMWTALLYGARSGERAIRTWKNGDTHEG